MRKFDAIIIGSGQAGTPLAFRYAKDKKSVAFIEKEHLGGTCLNTGCTPTKAYVASARRMWDAQHGEELGILIPEGAKADMSKIKARKDALIQKSVDGITEGVENNEYISLFRGAGKFVDHKVVEVNGEQMTAEHIHVNVGGRPFVPPGYENVPFLDNQSILELKEVPEHLLVVGGSYIGLEFGQMFRRFGSKVTIIERNDLIIGREDRETSAAIQEFMELEGVEFRLGSECMTAEKGDQGEIIAKMDCGDRGNQEVKGSHLLLAVGRRPNTDFLDLEKTGVSMDERGFIQVNDRLQTEVEGIFALGDCNGQGAFTHTAYNDFEIVSSNLFEEGDRTVSDRIMTYGLFVDPPLGRVGMTKEQAQKSDRKILYGYYPMGKIARAKEKGETFGFMSVVIDAKTKTFLGATVLGTAGDEIISEFIHAMYAGMTYEEMRDTVLPHPTISELIPTMLESLEEL